MNLETKRNALMNSVASSSGGGIELLDTITITEDTASIDFNVDTSTYQTFFLVGDITYNQASGNWLYFRVNGANQTYAQSQVPQTFLIPDATNFYSPFIYLKTVDNKMAIGYAFRSGLGQNYKSNPNFDTITSIGLGSYQNSKYANGTKISLYGMRESITDLGV